MNPPLPGAFCWFELGTTDLAAAKSFYGSLFGWSANDTPMGPDGTYSIFQIDGRDVGAAYGLSKDLLAQQVPPHWLAYVAVEDVDACVTRVGELGGSVAAPAMDVGDHGRMAVLRDSTGATIAVWQPRAHQGVGVTGVAGTACWVELSTPDQDTAARFYSDLFGWEIVTGKSTNPAQPGDYLHIRHHGQFVGGILPTAARDAEAPPHWLVYFQVDDCEAATAKAVSLGALPYVDNMSIGEDGRISVLADPQRAAFALHQAGATGS